MSYVVDGMLVCMIAIVGILESHQENYATL